MFALPERLLGKCVILAFFWGGGKLKRHLVCLILKVMEKDEMML